MQTHSKTACQPTQLLRSPGEGQSDPFDSFPLKVTAEINRVMTFARDFYLPMVALPRRFRENIKRRESRSLQVCTEHAVRKRTIEQWITIASSSGEAVHAFFAFYAVCLDQMLPDERRDSMHRTALVLKGKLLQAVQLAMNRHKEGLPVSDVLVQRIVYLFIIDCCERNRDAAAVHARVLELMLTKLQDPVISFHLFVEALFYDAELASFLLQPTLLNHKHWYNTKLKPFWENNKNDLQCDTPVADIHTSITHPDIRQAILRTRRGFAIHNGQLLETIAEGEVDTSRLYAWWSDGVVHDTAVTVNLALSLSADSSSPNPLESTVPQNRLTAALAFTTFCTVRKYRREGIHDDVALDVQDFSEVLAPALQGYVQNELDDTAPAKHDRDEQEALYWMLFTGTLYEQTICRHHQRLRQGSEAVAYWFTPKLREQAHLLGLTRWVDAQGLLQRFVLQADWLDPHPDEWYEQVVK